MAITHDFTSAKADGADATLIRPSNWNANHTIAANTIGDAEIAAHTTTKITVPTTTFVDAQEVNELWEYPGIGNGYLQINIDGGGSAITTGVKGDLFVPFSITLTHVTMLGDQSGSIVVDIWNDTIGNHPPTVADTITASDKPTISTAVSSQSRNLTGWTTNINGGTVLRFNVDSITTLTRLHMVLGFNRRDIP